MVETQNFLLTHLEHFQQQISTPALIVNKQQMESNLRLMQTHADSFSMKLRPHCKTHKSVDFAKKQIALGAKGITVAKLSEALEMASAGIDDIFIANQIVQSTKMKEFRKLHEKINLIIGVDHVQQIEILQDEFENLEKPLSVRIEIDCGFARCGIVPDDVMLIHLAQNISEKKWLKLEGLFTHAGHAYSAKSKSEISDIARQEAAEILKAKKILNTNGIEVATISVGSTPTAKEVIEIEGITEARPGNYIFFDGIQQSLGVCSFEQCSLYILATVISQPSAERIICDAGSKALNLDRGAHPGNNLNGFGTILNLNGQIERVSEEHGIIILNEPANIKIGSPLLIIPNHACVVANLYDTYHVVDVDLSVQTVPISCRGMSQ